MTERDFEQALLNLLDAINEPDTLDVLGDTEIADEIDSAYSFEHAALMTRNLGVVVRMKNGDEFQIAIVQSRIADEVTS